MNVCIIGGGKVGFHLAKTLIRHRHGVVVVEKDPDLCRTVADRLDLQVICGDGTLPKVLCAAYRHKYFSSFVAATGNDETNLISCQIAKQLFPHIKTIARVNDPRNLYVMKKLGVDLTVSATNSIANILSREAESEEGYHQQGKAEKDIANRAENEQ